MTDLWLVRHGQTDWNLTGRWQGQTAEAPGLNDTGHAQSIAARELLIGIHFSAIYSSDLLRARQTAELIAEPLGLDITLESRLREIDLGIWEGMLSSEIESRYPQELAERAQTPLRARAPQGESPLETAERVIAVVTDIVKKYPHGSVLIISHGAPLAIIICHAQNIPLDEVYEHIPDNAKPCRMAWNSKG